MYGPLPVFCDTKCDIATTNKYYLLICCNKHAIKNIEFFFENSEINNFSCYIGKALFGASFPW